MRLCDGQRVVGGLNLISFRIERKARNRCGRWKRFLLTNDRDLALRRFEELTVVYSPFAYRLFQITEVGLGCSGRDLEDAQ